MEAENPSSRQSLREVFTDRLGWLGVRSAQILLVIILAAIVVYGLIQLKLVVIPVLVALILAAAVGPVVNAMRRRGISSILATWITLLAGIAVFGGVITLIVFAVRNQWDELATSAVEGLDQLQNLLSNGPIPVDEEQINGAREAVVQFLTSSSFGSGALAGVSAAGEFITGALLTFVVLFFFLKDGGDIWNFFLRPFRGERLERGRRVGLVSLKVLGGYVRGTALIALVDAVGIGIWLVILQVPLALPLAVVVFVTAFIPIVGATLAGVLAALVALVANGPGAALLVLAGVVVVNQLEGNFLQPIIMARSLKLHALVILVALTAGTIIGGIVGAVLSVPIAAVAWAIIKVWHRPEDGSFDRPRRVARGAAHAVTAQPAATS
jgi:predicted PurR-regulated permease PerM